MYLYYPDIPVRSPFKRAAITVLRDTADEASVQALLSMGLQRLADEQELVLSFPNPLAGGWNYTMDSQKPNDIEDICELQYAMDKPDDEPLPVNEMGIPTIEAMLSTWHLMNDTKYIIGIGAGASMAYTMAACCPDNIAAVLGVNGVLCPAAAEKAVHSPIPVSIVNGDGLTLQYFLKCNRAAHLTEDENRTVYRGKVNPFLYVVWDKKAKGLTEAILNKVWKQGFSHVRRTNTGLHGDCARRINMPETGLAYYLNDTQLDGKEHTWFVHVPATVKAQKNVKVPMMIFYHGGSDTPADAAEMSKYHELGEKEGFITVYPWGTNRASWNSAMLPAEEDDLDFSVKLIDFMVQHYPVDAQRIYLSGFSNGAAMAQTVAMVYPEKIAAICHIDSNWPGNRSGAAEVDYQDITPMRIALQRKKEYDYRMPVWYTYGTREISYPVYKGCSQQHQYDFWKLYNNIPVKPTPPAECPDDSGCGVKGDITETRYPSEIYPHHWYAVQRFLTADEEPQNYYNYVVMHDKGHEVAEMDPALGWQYVKQYKRNEDGSVGKAEE